MRSSVRTVLAPGFSDRPWWWEAAPPETGDPAPLPSRVDVAVIGAGYAGLSAALTAARAGRSVLVLDAREPGWGASTRSVGMIGGRLRQGYAPLARAFGTERAMNLMHEARDAYGWFFDFVAGEGIACDLARSGRLVCAWTPGDLPRLDALARFLSGRVGMEATTLDRAGLRAEWGSDLHHGALLLPGDGGLHPAKYHAGLLTLARRAGAVVAGHTPVSGTRVDGPGIRLLTPRGDVVARHAILATNAHTGPGFGWHRRRVIPVGSYMIATEPLPRAALDRAIPHGRLVNDTRRLAYAFRRAPDGDRLLVGGRASARDHADPARVAAGLHRILRQAFPDLAGTRVAQAWGGMVGFTFDRIPSIGLHDGVHHVLGCNGSGVVMNTWLGRHAARMALGEAGAGSGFAQAGFPTRRFYTGTPWFMPPLSLAYAARDRIARLTER